MEQAHCRTEFFEAAVKQGFYGLDRGGLEGKKDNVRKYWEDTVTKLMILPAMREIMGRKKSVRIVDLGCGSGEGLELLTHIPFAAHSKPPHSGFLIWRGEIDQYVGVDVSPSMVAQGRCNYPEWPNVRFMQHDLSTGFPLMDEEPFDLYFSSYSSPSHLTSRQLQHIMEQVFSHVRERGYVLLDMFGRFSPEWPGYWGKSCHEMLPYTMAYLLPSHQRAAETMEWYHVSYWSAAELEEVLQAAARQANRRIRLTMKDRSVFIGRHMDTGIFNNARLQLRYQTNRLFDRGYRGDVERLRVRLDFLKDYHKASSQTWARLCEYQNQWNTVIDLLESLMEPDDERARTLIESAPETLASDLKMLAWLHRSAERFPVADFWASIMGPQVACVLRNIEFNFDGIGSGHGLLCLAEIDQE